MISFPSWVPTREKILLETKIGVSQSYFSMEWSLVKALLCALLLIVQIHEQLACVEEERMDLLELKVLLKSNVNLTRHLFLSENYCVFPEYHKCVLPPLT